MKSPRNRYLNDPMYHRLVDTMRAWIEQADFTPSEIREAAIFATIMHEEARIPRYLIPMTPEINARLEELHAIIDGAIKTADEVAGMPKKC